jgi:branched-chain amino acid transport system substrate-binding protein
VFFNITTPKFAAQAIKKAADIGWKPVQYLNNVSASVGSVINPAGLEKSVGHHLGAVPEGPDRRRPGRTIPRFKWTAFMKKYYPEGTSPTRPTCTATPWRRRWCRRSSSAATTSPART